ncbi:MAG: beta strand repeat-containing protein [Thermoguttaceae bacterium]
MKSSFKNSARRTVSTQIKRAVAISAATLVSAALAGEVMAATNVSLVDATPITNRTTTAGDVTATNTAATNATITAGTGTALTDKKIGFLSATGDITISAQNGTTVTIEKFDNSGGSTAVGAPKEESHGAAIYGEKSIIIGAAGSTGTLIFSENHAVHGGAILMDNADGTATNNFITILGGTNTFTKNTATGWGGALLADKVIISDGTNTSFTENKANIGGAISTSFGVDINGGTFTDNEATGGDGGAINIDNRDATGRSKVAGATFTTNKAAGAGGAIRTGVSMDVTGSTFTGNKSTSTTLGGGAIYVSNTATTNPVTFTVGTTTFTSNESAFNGGAIIGDGAAIAINDGTIFTKNTAGHAGGAIYTNSTITFKGTNMFGGATAADGNKVTNATGAALGGAIFSLNDFTLGASTDVLATDVRTFQNNAASGAVGAGGAIASDTGTITITGGTNKFISNTATGTVQAGGGAVASNKVITIAGGTNLFDQNKVTGPVAGGGAIYSAGGVTISGGTNTFTTNEVTGTTDAAGGAIAANNFVTVGGTNIFTGNKVIMSAGGGGAISSSAVTITGTNTFTSNEAFGGGAIVSNGGFFDISGNNTFTTNKGSYGGAIHITNSTDATKNRIEDASFTGNEATLFGGAIYTNSNVTIAAKTKDVTFSGNKVGTTGSYTNNDIHLDTNSIATFDAVSGKTVTLGGGVSGNGGSVIKTGSGTLTFADGSVNTYTGATTVNAGTLALKGSSSLATSSGLTLAGTSIFDISGVTSGTTVKSLTGAVGTSVALGGKTLTVGDATNTTFAGNIGGTGGSLVKNGAGTFTLSGANTYTGNTTVNAGTLKINGKLTGTGAVDIKNGATLGINVGTTPTLAATALTFNASGKLDITGYTPGTTVGSNSQTVITSGSAIVGFPATVTVAGQVTATDFLSAEAKLSADQKSVIVDTNLTWYSTDPTRKAHGDFTIGTGNTFSLGAVLKDNSASTNKAAGWDGTTLTKKGAGTLVLSNANEYTGATTISDGTLEVTGSLGKGTYAGAIANSGTLTMNQSVAQTLSGVISGAGNLVKSSTGTLTLTGANTYTGGTTISGGTVVVSNNAALGTSGVTMQNGTTLKAGAAVTTANAITVASGAKTTLDNGGNAWTIGTVTGTGTGGDISFLGANTTTTGAITTTGGVTIGDSTKATVVDAGINNVAAGSLTLKSASTLIANDLTAASYLDANAAKVVLTGAAKITGDADIYSTDFAAKSLEVGGLYYDVAATQIKLTNGATFANDTTIHSGNFTATTISMGTGKNLTFADGAIVKTSDINANSLTVTARALPANAPIQADTITTLDLSGVTTLVLKTNAAEDAAVAVGATVDRHVAYGFASITRPTNVDTSLINPLFTYTPGTNLGTFTMTRNSAVKILPKLSGPVAASVDSYRGEGNGFLNAALATEVPETATRSLELGYNMAGASGVGRRAFASRSLFSQVLGGIPSTNGAMVAQLGAPREQMRGQFGGLSFGGMQRAVWVMPQYGHQSSGDLMSGGVKYKYTSDQYAVAFGVEASQGAMRFGIAGNLGGGKQSSTELLGVRTRSDSFFGGVAGYTTVPLGYVILNAQFGWVGANDKVKQLNSGGELAATVDGGVTFVNMTLEKPFLFGRFVVTPQVGLEYDYVYQSAFNTTFGGTNAFNASSASANVVTIPVGLKAAYSYIHAGGIFTPEFRARVLPVLGDRYLDYKNTPVGAQLATLRSVIADGVAGDANIGFNWRRGLWDARVDYGVQFSENFTNQGVNFMVRRTF